MNYILGDIEMAGTQKRTDDGIIGGSGKKIRVFDIILRSDAVGATSVAVHDGTGTGGTLMANLVTSGASVTAHYPFEKGLYLGSGCYLNVGANIDYVVVNYEQES
jgi:hypothetical protein